MWLFGVTISTTTYRQRFDVLLTTNQLLRFIWLRPVIPLLHTEDSGDDCDNCRTADFTAAF